MITFIAAQEYAHLYGEEDVGELTEDVKVKGNWSDRHSQIIRTKAWPLFSYDSLMPCVAS